MAIRTELKPQHRQPEKAETTLFAQWMEQWRKQFSGCLSEKDKAA
ncbi:hypothetical protein [Kingella oralis]